MPEIQDVFPQLAAALAIGLLIGLERGWQSREAEQGNRVAGVRTYGLIGLLGGVAGLLSTQLGAAVWGFGFLGLAVVLTTAYAVNHPNRKDAGVTSLIAALLTFGFGAMAVRGQLQAAGAFAVLTTLLLGFKPLLHRWVEALTGSELRAVLQLLLISVVLLPILPDRGYGPWQALNPYEIWWMVVLIASISFVGYFSVRIVGTRRGTLFTGLFAGLASSTALTLHFARVAREKASLSSPLAVGILLACGTMVPRMLLVAGLLNPALLPALLPPALVMAAVIYGAALLYWWRGSNPGSDTEAPLGNPLEIKSAIGFGALLAGVMVFARALKSWVGDAGVLVVAAASGVADVDAINLSLARMSSGDITLTLAAQGIILAAAVNTIIKGAMAGLIGGSGLALRAALPLALSGLTGLAVAYLTLGTR